jgi:hypothetical protein
MIISIVPDRHKSQMAAEAEAAKSGGSEMRVRRPTRGIEIKADTYATLKVITGRGDVIQLTDGGSVEGGVGQPYSNFLIQAVTEERMEKQQVVETFGEAFIFFYGERPRVLSIQGVLINTFDFNWEAEWWHNYDNYLRGTKCVEKDARVYLSYDETIVSGYILGTNSTKSAQERHHVPFAFQLYVTDYTQVPEVGNRNADPDGVKQRSVDNYESLSGEFGAVKIPYKAVASDKSLIGALTGINSIGSGLSAVVKTWNTAFELVQNATITANSFLGNPVRVPYGFAGALSYDPEKLPEAAVASDQTVITFTNFSDNDDEFVGGSQFGSGGQYASAWAQLGSTIGNKVEDASDLVATATKEWAKNGLVAPPAVLATAFQVAKLTGVGMKQIGSAQQWANKQVGKKDVFVEKTAADAAKVAGVGTLVVSGVETFQSATSSSSKAPSDRALLPGIL